jgi:hypothetical protein
MVRVEGARAVEVDPAERRHGEQVAGENLAVVADHEQVGAEDRARKA